MPLWLREEPHCRMDEWIALKMWFALCTFDWSEFAEATEIRQDIEKGILRIKKCILRARRPRVPHFQAATRISEGKQSNKHEETKGQ